MGLGVDLEVGVSGGDKDPAPTDGDDARLLGLNTLGSSHSSRSTSTSLENLLVFSLSTLAEGRSRVVVASGW